MNMLQERTVPAPSRPPVQTGKPPQRSGPLRGFREWAHIHLRRWAYLLHGAAVESRAVGPITFLGVSAALGAALTVTTLYAASYTVTVDGQDVGVVADQGVVATAVRTVEKQGSSLLGRDYRVEGEIDYQFTLTLKTELTDEREIETFFYEQLNELSDDLRKYELLVDGRVMGTVQDEAALNAVLEALKAQYITENTTETGFVEDVKIEYVYSSDHLMSVEELADTLTASAVGETTYTVAKGDTFNAIAYANDMSSSELRALNPDTDVNRLSIGQVLNVKEMIPNLSVQTLEHQVYTQPIECPVETVEDDSMYKGDSKILTQGEEGEARVEADVTFVNGYERERNVVSTTTLREPTTTVKAVGTKEKPKTASKGYFVWPVRGRITSYFGGRTLYGRYDYHSGLDIATSYGVAVKAADGGTVTKAGYSGSYGNLVVITHDNGIQTYYAHNSRLDVAVGDKVYQGQTIARVGSTGNSTGPHCHFEVRVRGSAVNPLSYLQ
ncbi:MAG: peptidoglycan DD-metalloendopeptidase family protein [Lawsonibacter sp.]|nr:peptidoglycan DD-metalloendopeptidase family protein [Lawsonibacter sp.]